MISDPALVIDLCVRVGAIVSPVVPAGVTVEVIARSEGPVLHISGPEGATIEGPLPALGTIDGRVEKIEDLRLALLQILEILQSGVSTAIDRYWPRQRYQPRVEIVANTARLSFERNGQSQLIEIGVIELPA